MSSPWKLLANTNRAEQIALYGGSPAELIALQGSIRRVEVIETLGNAPVVAASAARVGDPLIDVGITIWIEGFFPSTIQGEPVIEDRATTLETWNALHAMLMTTDYELFLHYDAETPLYRKHRELSTALIRMQWADTLGVPYQFAAITSNRTLYDQEPGLP